MLITREELALHRLVLDRTYSAVRFHDLHDDFELTAAVRVQGAAELAGADIRVYGHIGTVIRTTCDRCAAAVELPVEHDFDLLYRPVSAIAREEEIEVPAGELDVGFYSGDGVDLIEIVKEQLILALPMKVVCRPECRGLCPICGANLNVRTCRCTQIESESPFGSLLKSSVR